MHILLADDSRSTALPIIQFLKQQGYRVTHAENGAAALEAYKADPPDLVLMDIVMPVMDGVQATRAIKALGGGRWVPIMLMTSLTSKDDIVAGFDAGADDYLIKPVVFEVLAARMRSMQRIAVMQDSLRGVLDNVYEAILTIDEQGTVLSFNKAAERIFGYAGGEVMGRNVKMLMPPPHADQHDGYLARYLRERIPHVIGIGRKVEGRRKNGEVFPMRLSVTEVGGAQGAQFIGLVADITQEEEARRHIEYLALHDPLTRLPNRARFNQVFEDLFARPPSGTSAVLFVDLDGFKPVNDSLGHDAGDEALRVIAGRMRHQLAAGDFVARLGGDEFVAILPEVPGPDAAAAVARRLIEAVSNPMTLNGAQVTLGASVGIALIPQHGTTATDVLTAADDAMYAAKRAGKGRAVMAGQSPAGD